MITNLSVGQNVHINPYGGWTLPHLGIVVSIDGLETHCMVKVKKNASAETLSESMLLPLSCLTATTPSENVEIRDWIKAVNGDFTPESDYGRP